MLACLPTPLPRNLRFFCHGYCFRESEETSRSRLPIVKSVIGLRSVPPAPNIGLYHMQVHSTLEFRPATVRYMYM